MHARSLFSRNSFFLYLALSVMHPFVNISDLTLLSTSSTNTTLSFPSFHSQYSVFFDFSMSSFSLSVCHVSLCHYIRFNSFIYSSRTSTMSFPSLCILYPIFFDISTFSLAVCPSCFLLSIYQI